jgi:hypothetical protein
MKDLGLTIRFVSTWDPIRDRYVSRLTVFAYRLAVLAKKYGHEIESRDPKRLPA